MSVMSYLNPVKQADYQRNWIAARRAEWLAANGPCVFCGSSERLEVDHIDPATKTSHNVWSWSRERREEELAKCRVLCYDCHKKVTSEQRRAKTKHGTYGRYRYHECRCVLCVEACRVRPPANDPITDADLERKRLSYRDRERLALVGS